VTVYKIIPVISNKTPITEAPMARRTRGVETYRVSENIANAWAKNPVAKRSIIMPGMP
jgi:hypothetical protein